MQSRLAGLALLFCIAAWVRADGPADNLSESVRPVPPPGIAISAEARGELEQGVATLGKEMDTLRSALKSKATLLEFLPDVEIYQKAVAWPLRYNEFYNTNQIAIARKLIDQGRERGRQLKDGHVPWAFDTGLVARGYRSKIDGSIQPYGLVVPPSYSTNFAHPFRLDIWFHGRGEMLTELDFVNQREKSYGEFTPTNTFVLHLYGRYCNANKFAGEVDLFEALEVVRKNYPIDENRIAVRGFSMGGAACWQFATHYAGLWAAAAPGAGFSETAEFLKMFQNETVTPTWYERKLWHLYDATDYARNLFNCPTVAYSGGIDKQKQAADIMASAMAKEGLQLTHIIGPQTAHKYHPDAKNEIIRRMASIMDRGRNPVPNRVQFTTYTLRYNEMLWVTVDALERHWERADVDAEIVNDHTVKATTRNVDALTFSMSSGFCPLDASRKPRIILDGKELDAPPGSSDRAWTAKFRKVKGRWSVVENDLESLTKKHGLQGPIDDAFMDSFVMVEPTGQEMNDKVAQWTKSEMSHAVDHWRRQFRGEARVKKDSEISDEDIASSNLILWGDPQSNRVLARLADKLPVRWTADSVIVGTESFPAGHHAPVLIYPNPLNPKHYVVLNSGFTFREYDYLSNARQVPKLPDYAIVDIDTPVTSRSPGKIVAAGFFDEHWQLKRSQK